MDSKCAKLLNKTLKLAQRNCSRINDLVDQCDCLQPVEVYGNVGGVVGRTGTTTTFATEIETENVTWDSTTHLFNIDSDGLYTVSYSVPFGAGVGFTVISFGVNGAPGASARPGAEHVDSPTFDNASVSGTSTLRLSDGDTVGVYVENVVGSVNPSGPIGSFTIYSLQL